MATSFNLSTLQDHKFHFLRPTQFTKFNHKSSSSSSKQRQSSHQIKIPYAKFNLYEILGGRGLCNGEEGLQLELEKPPPEKSPPPTSPSTGIQEDPVAFSVPEDGFEKELLGLTGGFPGGEKGLKDFIQKNPPPKKTP